eukprot:COSAG01_NODE_3772_length_5711_cov_67.083393_8_plen_57_part_00
MHHLFYALRRDVLDFVRHLAQLPQHTSPYICKHSDVAGTRTTQPMQVATRTAISTR